MASSDLLAKTVLQIRQMIQDGLVSKKEVMAACAKRIEDIKALNAFVTVVSTEGDAIKQSKQPLCGIPFSVKDNFCTKGSPTNCASKMLRDFEPRYNATVVQRLLDAGGYLNGKNNMDEFAMGSGTIESIFGPTKNPWKYDFSCGEEEQDWHVAGGSSGGSAVAVATGASYFSIGSDTGGSVRHPAAFCGVVGLKPSYGRFSRHGLVTLVNMTDCPGIISKSVQDAAFICNILSGHDHMDSTSFQNKPQKIDLQDEESVKDLVVGIPKEYYGPNLSEESMEIWDWAAGAFSDAGAKVVQVSLPHMEHSVNCYSVLCYADVASNMARYDGLEYGHRVEGRFLDEMYAKTRSSGFNQTVRERIVAGNYFLLQRNYKKYYEKALKIRRLIYEDFKKVLNPSLSSNHSGEQVDVLLTPLNVVTAPRFKDFSCKHNRTSLREQDVNTIPANLAGIPAIAVPTRLASDGLPISLQLMSGHFQEHTLLRAAKFLEQVSHFPKLTLKFP